MDIDPQEPIETKKRFTESLLWRFMRWLPLMVLSSAAVSLAVMLLMGGMVKVTGWYLLQLVLPLLGVTFLIIIAVYALIRRRLSKPLLITGSISLLALLPAVLLVSPLTYPASLTGMTPAATVRLPADAPLQVIWGGDSIAVNYHAATPDQRWAYDFVVAPYFLGTEEPADYGCYGIPVVAPIAGEVVAAHDGEPDMIPGALSNNIQAPTGNFVALKLADTGTYLILAHLKPGSVLVEVGEMVQEGQVIGQCGNSGNTSEPHIHIHHQRQDPNLYPTGFAEGLPLYFRDHDGASMPEGGVRVEDDEAIATGAVVRHLGR